MRKSQNTSLHSQASTITKASLMAHHVPTHSLPCQRFLPSPSSADRWSTRNVIQISLFNQISTRFACLTGQCDMVMWLTKVQIGALCLILFHHQTVLTLSQYRQTQRQTHRPRETKQISVNTKLRLVHIRQLHLTLKDTHNQNAMKRTHKLNPSTHKELT